MTIKLAEKNIYEFIIKDFEEEWNSVSINKDTNIGRGNFTFAFKAINLLEFACRICQSDLGEKALVDFSNKLLSIEKRYFTHLPNLSVRVQKGEITLPYIKGQERDDLLLSLF
ncbi:MAG: hypothetical protein WBQ25_00890 [Nitrososphaeraceae archaeon]